MIINLLINTLYNQLRKGHHEAPLAHHISKCTAASKFWISEFVSPRIKLGMAFKMQIQKVSNMIYKLFRIAFERQSNLIAQDNQKALNNF